MAVAAILAMPSIALAQSPTATARIVEWNCPLAGSEVQAPPPDPFPGALVADGNFVWFVTRSMPRLVRFLPGAPRETAPGTCNWWELDELSIQTGGLRLKPWGNTAYIRTVNDLQRIDTAANRRTTWNDNLFTSSDVAIRQNGSYTYVYTTGTALLGSGVPDAGALPEPISDGVVQRFTPPATCTTGSCTGTAKRWEVGGGAGDINVQLSGIDVHPSNPSLVYYSEPLANNIGELNTSTNQVRRWNLFGLGVFEPRHLDVDANGMVWVVTGSGHLVKLNPCNDQVLVTPIPTLGLVPPIGDAANNPFALDADSVIGYTAAGGVEGFNKVGMLFPSGNTMSLPHSGPTTVFAETVSIAGAPVTVPQFTGTAAPIVKIAQAHTDEDAPDGGTFFEADIDTGIVTDMSVCGDDVADPDNPCFVSTQPTGISNDPRGGLGQYYSAIGFSVLRIAHVSLPVPLGGSVVGSGKVPVFDPITGAQTGTGTFTISVSRKKFGLAPKGTLTYVDPSGTVTSAQITDLTFSGNSATITGVCKPGSNCTTFKVTVVDGGWNCNQDSFKIVRDPILGLGFEQGGTLLSGNIRISR
jgi:hypothetical protein